MAYEPPEVEPDSADQKGWHLPRSRIPEPVMRGIKGHKTSEGYLVLRVHYSCDPDRATEEWKNEQVIGYPGGFGGSKWQREMEIDFGSFAGEPIYPTFDPNSQVKVCKYNPSLPLWRGWDFGYRNPAVGFFQLWPDNTLVKLHEIFPTVDKESVPGLTTADLARLVINDTDRLFPEAGHPDKSAGVFDFCDPAGTQKKETSDMSSVEVLHSFGIVPEFNVVGRKTRIAYMREYVEGKHPDGKPKFLINPHCVLSIKAYHKGYRRPPEGKGTNDPDMPDLSKTVQSEPYIHLIDADEYMAACNLQIENPVHTRRRPQEEATSVTDLASAYLGTTAGPTDRLASGPSKPVEQGLEDLLNDLIGEESLEDAWILD